MLTVAQRVQNGVEWLDREHPGWLDKINLGRLDMSCPYSCIVAQVCGKYTTGMQYYSVEFECTHGFEHSTHEPENCEFHLDDYKLLTAEWKRVINEFREVAV